MLKKILLMLQFYTRIPVLVDLKGTGEDYGKGMAYAPIIGAVLGALCAAVYYVAGYLAQGIFPAVCSVVFYCYITGGLHIDGLGDTFDGIFSNRERDEMLSIMKDSRLGTNALVAVFSVLLFNIACISSFDREMGVQLVFCMPVIGRLSSCLSCGMAHYAREDGIGKSFITYCKIKQMIIASLLTLAILWFVLKINTLYFIIASFLFIFCFVNYITKKIGGMTGDTCGAACEISQSVFLGLAMVLCKLGVM